MDACKISPHVEHEFGHASAEAVVRDTQIKVKLVKDDEVHFYFHAREPISPGDLVHAGALNQDLHVSGPVMQTSAAVISSATMRSRDRNLVWCTNNPSVSRVVSPLGSVVNMHKPRCILSGVALERK